jgi:hypothetical protein
MATIKKFEDLEKPGSFKESLVLIRRFSRLQTINH